MQLKTAGHLRPWHNDQLTYETLAKTEIRHDSPHRGITRDPGLSVQG